MTYGVCDRCLAQQKSWKEGDDFGFLERNLQLTHIKSHRPYKLICTTYNCCRVFTTASEYRMHFIQCTVQKYRDAICGDLSSHVRTKFSLKTIEKICPVFASKHSSRNWDKMVYALCYQDNDARDMLLIPKDPSLEWGFDAQFVITKLQAYGGKYIKWKQFYTDNQEYFTPVFTDLVQGHCDTDKFLPRLLQHLIRASYPECMLLNKEYRLKLKDKELLDIYDDYEITFNDLSCVNLHIVNPNISPPIDTGSTLKLPAGKFTSWTDICDYIGNASFKKNKYRAFKLKQAMNSVGIDILLIDSLLPYSRDTHNTYFSRRKLIVPQESAIPCSKLLRDYLQIKLQDKDSRTLMIGESFPVSAVVVKRMRRTTNGFKQIEISKNLVGRIQRIRPILKNIISDLVTRNHISHGCSELHLQTWLDGSTLSKLSTVLGIWRILYDQSLTGDKLDADSIRCIRKPRTWLTVPMHESRKDLQIIFDKLIRQEIMDIEKDPITIANERNFKVVVRMFIADNKCMQLVIGIDNGKCPCSHCYTPRALFKDYYASVTAFKRSMDTIMERVINSKKDIVNFGDKNIPMFSDFLELSDDNGNISKEYFCVVKSLIAGIDSLHDIQNVGKDLVEVSFDEFASVHPKALVIERFKLHTNITVIDNNNKISFADTTCANIRLMFIVVETMFFQMDTTPRLKKIMEVLKSFRNIICILYSNICVRSNCTVLLLYVHSFVFHQKCIKILGDKSIFSLPFHQMVIHLPMLSRIFYLSDLSSEAFEALWKDLRFFETYFSCHYGDIVKGWLVRLYYCEKMESICGRRRNEESLFFSVSLTYQQLLKPTTIPSEMIWNGDSFIKDFSALLFQIGDYYMGEWWTINDDNSVTFFPFFKDSGLTSIPTLPKIYSYSTITLAELQKQIEKSGTENPGYHYFEDVSITTTLDDSIKSSTIDPNQLTAVALKSVISWRVNQMSKFDWRKEYLILKKQDPHDELKLRDLTSKMLKERVEYDNKILKFRENNCEVPSNDHDYNHPQTVWNIYCEKEKQICKIPEFTEFEKKKTRVSADHIRIEELFKKVGSKTSFSIFKDENFSKWKSEHLRKMIKCANNVDSTLSFSINGRKDNLIERCTEIMDIFASDT